MTLEEFEAEAERLGFRKKETDFVPHFEHAASGRRVDYVPMAGNCHFIDCARTLDALRAVTTPGTGEQSPQDTPTASGWMGTCGVRFRKAPATLAWSLRRLQEEALSTVVGRGVVVSEETTKGEALEIDALLPGHGRSWLVLHPNDAETMVKAATAPKRSETKD